MGHWYSLLSSGTQLSPNAIVRLGIDTMWINVGSDPYNDITVFEGDRKDGGKWLHEGPWQDDFLSLVVELEDDKKDKEEEEEMRVQGILDSYKRRI